MTIALGSLCQCPTTLCEEPFSNTQPEPSLSQLYAVSCILAECRVPVTGNKLPLNLPGCLTTIPCYQQHLDEEFLATEASM